MVVVSLDAYGTIFRGGSDAFVALVRELAAAHRADADALLARREAIIREVSASGFVNMRARDRRVLGDLFARLGTSRDVEATLDDLEKEYRHVDVYEDARRLVDALDARGVRWGVASNTDAPVMGALLREHRLRPAFVVTSESARAYKPSPALFRAVVAAAGVPARDVLHVGDSWTADVEGARGVGLRAVWVRRPGGLPRPAASAAEAEAVVERLDDVLALL